MPSLKLLVLYTADIEALKHYYDILGLAFKREQHGKGPEHYSCVLPGNLVLEIYPGEADKTRLGFEVEDLSLVLACLSHAGHRFGKLHARDGYTISVVRDPDDRRIELSQKIP